MCIESMDFHKCNGYTNLFVILPKISIWLLKELVLLSNNQFCSTEHIALDIKFYVIF